MKAYYAKPFRGGIRLSSEKLSRDLPVEKIQPPDRVTVPLGSARAVVKTGDHVCRGELIAAREGKFSANVHASVSGIVILTEKREDGDYLVIENDFSARSRFMEPLLSPSPDRIAERIEEAGIVGMGGAGFPTAVKVSGGKKIDTLILNGAECEPYLTADDRIMRERTSEIVRGGRYLARAVGAERVVIAIEKNKPEAVALFEKTELEVCVLNERYPAGSEKQLVYSVTGRKVPPARLPADAGVLVQNVATALAVNEAIEEGKPLIERVVTLSGKGAIPKNLLCPIGAPLSSFFPFVNANAETVRVVDGGIMTGKRVSRNAAVAKTTGGFLFLTAEEINDESPSPCINCGRCAAACPMRLMPMQIEFYTAARKFALAEKYGGVLSCIGCGACSYVCPAHRPLNWAIRLAKNELRRNA